MWLIISLIIIGVLLLVAELILLPGLSVAGIGSLISYGIAIYLGFTQHSATIGLLVILAVVLLSVLALFLSLRARTWKKLALSQEIDGKAQGHPEDRVAIGDKGTTLTRLAPMGKVDIGGNTYEAKSLGDRFLDPQKDVEVVGFENFNIVVKTI